MGKTIALSCIKGGVGKTTTATSLGGILASRGKKVLLVDLDPQFNLTRTFFPEPLEESIVDAFDAFRPGKAEGLLPVLNVRDGLDIVPSSRDAVGIETKFLSKPYTMLILKALLAPLKGRYDYIFLDCPAQIGVCTGNALAAADYLLVPMSCDAYSMDGLEHVLSFASEMQMQNPDLKPLGIFLTKFRANQLVDQHVREDILANCGELLMNTRIRHTNSLVKAPMFCQDIWSYDKRSAGAQDYEALLEELLKRLRSKKFQ